MKHATVTSETTVILPSGRGGKLPAGRYEVAELDGTAGKLFLLDANRELVQANPHDPNITIEEN